jgi:hypothetical protein
MENSGAGANMVINAADQAHGRKPKPNFGLRSVAWCLGVGFSERISQTKLPSRI